MFFRARSTTEGRASIGAAPKLKSSFRGVKTVGIWPVLCGAEKQAQRQVGTVWGPPGGGGASSALVSLQVRIGESGTQEQGWASDLDLGPIPDFP